MQCVSGTIRPMSSCFDRLLDRALEFASHTVMRAVSCWVAIAFSLFILSGCAGGFQGARPAAPIAPLVVTQPANQTVLVGQTATFAVTASGTGPMTYQWYKNGVPIGGATSSTYTTPPTVAGDTGALFTVSVSGPAGMVVSAPATLAVQSPPPPPPPPPPLAGSIV